jgi:hypothetical protein
VGLEAYNNYDGWRYETYGSDSFTQSQMDWLASDLAAASASTARVLFYHYDFTDQINLNSLGAAMALAGHTHTDQNDFTPPYDIVTRSACDGNRAYRLIRVSGGAPVPTATLSAGSSGKALDVTYEPANDGSSTSLTAHVANGTGQRFEHGLLRFVLPNVTGLVDVTGGTLSQVDRSGPHAVCYVEVDIGASGTQDVTINLATTDLEAPTVTLASPNGGEVWEIGSTHDITWTATDNVGVAGVTLVFSSDGGATYVDTLAVSEPNDGIYTWAVDAGATSAARIRAVAYDVDGNAGSDGSNGDFEVTGGGADKPAHLVIAGAAPNPFNRQAVIRFGLPAHETAEIKLYEVSGRLVGTLVRAPYDAGYHTFDWTSSSSLGAGIYILRLEAGAESAACKVVIPR